MATILDGKRTAQVIRNEVKERVSDAVGKTGKRPGLAVVLVGEDSASAVYVRNKKRASQEAGMLSFSVELPASATTREVRSEVEKLNQDPRVHGILVQLPLPAAVDTTLVLDAISPVKDVDGLTPTNMGHLMTGTRGLLPCTPAGVMELLSRYDLPVAGQRAVVIGRSQLVGLPLSLLLLQHNATVTMVHSKTADPHAIARQADILVAAIGRPNFINQDWIKPGAVVIDVGINRVDTGLVGDVNFQSVRDVASHITPVPGGVGPMTVAMLLQNTWFAFLNQEGL